MTNIFKVDVPIRRSLYFVISTLVSIAVIIEGQIISPWTVDVLNNNLVLINIIEISVGLFFTYLYLMNDSKRLWEICGDKKVAIVIAGCACFVKLLNDILFFLKVIDVKIGLIIFSLLCLYYLFVLFLPKDSLTAFVEEMSRPQVDVEEIESSEEGVVEVSQDVKQDDAQASSEQENSTESDADNKQE